MAKILLKTLLITSLFVFIHKESVSAKWIKPMDNNLMWPYGQLENPIAEKKYISKFYPNPARDFITFEFEGTVENNSRLVIYSFTGTKMTEIQISNLKKTINLSDYYRGLYLFQLISPKGQILESGKFQVIK